MKKFAVAAALALFLLWTPDAQAQDATMAQWVGTWTPVGSLPAGQRHAPKDAQTIEFAVRLAANDAQGQVVIDRPAGTTQYKMENLTVYFGASGQPPAEYFTFAWEPREDYWLSCTLSNRGGEPMRFSGLCWDETQREGWMEMWRGRGQAPTPQEGRPEQG